MSILTDAMDVANGVTLDLGLQALVSYERCAAVDGKGKKTYDPVVLKRAVVEMKQRQVKTPSGELAMSQASVLFLDYTLVIQTEDRITLPSGQTGPILTMDGYINPESGQPLLTQVYLG